MGGVSPCRRKEILVVNIIFVCIIVLIWFVKVDQDDF